MSFQYDFETLKEAIKFNTVELLPSDEKQLNDRRHLTFLARKIRQGIDEYFEREQ